MSGFLSVVMQPLVQRVQRPLPLKKALQAIVKVGIGKQHCSGARNAVMRRCIVGRVCKKNPSTSHLEKS